MVEIGIVSVCGNTMCYLNYREAEVQVLNVYSDCSYSLQCGIYIFR